MFIPRFGVSTFFPELILTSFLPKKHKKSSLLFLERVSRGKVNFFPLPRVHLNFYPAVLRDFGRQDYPSLFLNFQDDFAWVFLA